MEASKGGFYIPPYRGRANYHDHRRPGRARCSKSSWEFASGPEFAWGATSGQFDNLCEAQPFARSSNGVLGSASGEGMRSVGPSVGFANQGGNHSAKFYRILAQIPRPGQLLNARQPVEATREPFGAVWEARAMWIQARWLWARPPATDPAASSPPDGRTMLHRPAPDRARRRGCRRSGDAESGRGLAIHRGRWRHLSN